MECSQGIKHDQFDAAICSRLYLVETELGNHTAAEKYYKLAATNCQKYCASEKRPPLTQEEVRMLIEMVDKNVQVPQWKGQINVSCDK